MNQNNHPTIKHKLGLLELAEQLKNVSRACKLMGVSRDTFYRIRNAYQEDGIEALLARSRKVPNVKNRVEPIVEESVLKWALENPAFGQARVSNELRKQGIFVSVGGVRSIWLRHNLETFKKRLVHLEKHMATTNGIYTESQLAALEKKKEDDIACDEIETAHPGYLGSQDTFFVGTLKGVGRVYQQTFVDTYSKVAQCKLYTMKTPITAADLLNDRVLPFYAQYEIPMLRILTDRGTEFCGKYFPILK